jgi:heptosyltransferase-2
MKILVHAPNWLGDAVMALPAVAAVRRGYPQAEVWIAAKAGAGDVFAAAGLTEGTLALPKKNDLKSLRQAARRIREAAFDAGLLLTNSFGSALLFFLAGIPERWGYAADGRSLLLTKAVRPRHGDGPRHQVHYYLDLAAKLGFEAPAVAPKISLPAGDLETAGDRLRGLGIDPARPLVVLSPGAGYGPAKRWPAARFARAAAILQESRRAEVLIIGAASESGIAEAVRGAMAKAPAVLTGQTSLRELLGLIGRATLVISNDTGPMHLANALSVPVVGVFGPTDPEATGPFGPLSRVVKKNVPCWPCYYRKCPLDHRCMTLISAEEVAGAAGSLWP